jgi:branched-subunit amino acid transport protein AzlD
MDTPNSNESSSTKSTAGAWLPVDFLAIIIWLTIPSNVFFGRQLILSGGLELSTGTQYLIGSPALRMVSILAIGVVLGAATIHHHKTRRLFMKIALTTGVFVVIVYVMYCLAPAMTALHRLG